MQAVWISESRGESRRNRVGAVEWGGCGEIAVHPTALKRGRKEEEDR